jgi:hypothetical protein
MKSVAANSLPPVGPKSSRGGCTFVHSLTNLGELQ